jgi:hypothetical protein
MPREKPIIVSPSSSESSAGQIKGEPWHENRNAAALNISQVCPRIRFGLRDVPMPALKL